MISKLSFYLSSLVIFSSLATSSLALGQETELPTQVTYGSSHTILSRALDGGPIIFLVLLTLILMSIMCWSIVIQKWLFFRKISKNNYEFIEKFWEADSLNDLNSKMSQFPDSPIKNIFKSGYEELIDSLQLKKQTTSSSEVILKSSMDNLLRCLIKIRNNERRGLENKLSYLAICASAAPFIGLFGTVWGIMKSFEGIAQSGGASLAAIAPGISEALIATAFGLVAAIPAVVGYNIFANSVRGEMAKLDSFSNDFLNIVERYLVNDITKS